MGGVGAGACVPVRAHAHVCEGVGLCRCGVCNTAVVSVCVWVRQGALVRRCGVFLCTVRAGARVRVRAVRNGPLPLGVDVSLSLS